MKKMVITKRALTRKNAGKQVGLTECFISSGGEPNTAVLHGYDDSDGHRRYCVALNAEMVQAIAAFATGRKP